MNNKLTKYARNLRKFNSDAESRLWFKLRNRQLCRYKFRRQYVIEPYIVDFVCLWKRVIIELDGGQHGEVSAMRYDAKRTRFLESKGFTVLRFWNDVVLRETEAVMETILAALDGRIFPSP